MAQANTGAHTASAILLSDREGSASCTESFKVSDGDDQADGLESVCEGLADGPGHICEDWADGPGHVYEDRADPRQTSLF